VQILGCKSIFDSIQMFNRVGARRRILPSFLACGFLAEIIRGAMMEALVSADPEKGNYGSAGVHPPSPTLWNPCPARVSQEGYVKILQAKSLESKYRQQST
jgi:hypothetical protein